MLHAGIGPARDEKIVVIDRARRAHEDAGALDHIGDGEAEPLIELGHLVDIRRVDAYMAEMIGRRLLIAAKPLVRGVRRARRRRRLALGFGDFESEAEAAWAFDVQPAFLVLGDVAVAG